MDEQKRVVKFYSNHFNVTETQGEGDDKRPVCVAVGTASAFGIWHLMVLVGSNEHVTTTISAVTSDGLRQLILAAVREKRDGA